MNDDLRKAAEAEFNAWLEGYADHLATALDKALGIAEIDPERPGTRATHRYRSRTRTRNHRSRTKALPPSPR